jgi:MFS family permease
MTLSPCIALSRHFFWHYENTSSLALVCHAWWYSPMFGWISFQVHSYNKIYECSWAVCLSQSQVDYLEHTLFWCRRDCSHRLMLVLCWGLPCCRLGGARAINRRYISDHVPVKELTSASAAFVSASALGMAAGPALAGFFNNIDFQVSPCPSICLLT